MWNQKETFEVVFTPLSADMLKSFPRIVRIIFSCESKTKIHIGGQEVPRYRITSSETSSQPTTCHIITITISLFRTSLLNLIAIFYYNPLTTQQCPKINSDETSWNCWPQARCGSTTDVKISYRGVTDAQLLNRSVFVHGSY